MHLHLNGRADAFYNVVELELRQAVRRDVVVERERLGRGGAHPIGGLEDRVVYLERLVFSRILALFDLELLRNLLGPPLEAGVDGLDVDARVGARASCKGRAFEVGRILAGSVDTHARGPLGLYRGKLRVGQGALVVVALQLAARVVLFFGLGDAGIARRRRSFGLWHCEAAHARRFRGLSWLCCRLAGAGNGDGMTMQLLHGVAGASVRRALACIHCGASHARYSELPQPSPRLVDLWNAPWGIMLYSPHPPPAPLETVVQIHLPPHHARAVFVHASRCVRDVASCSHQEVVYNALAGFAGCAIVSRLYLVTVALHIPGVCRSLLWGMWNWIVLGGLKISISSSSSSLS